MKKAILYCVVILTASLAGCGGKKASSKSSTMNKSDDVVALINDTAKIYQDYAKQIESSLTSGREQNDIVNGLKTISDRYSSRLKIEIGSEFGSLETAEIRAYYMAIAGHEAEREDLVDPKIKTAVEKLRSLGSDTPVADHVKGHVVTFLNHSNSSASQAILDSRN